MLKQQESTEVNGIQRILTRLINRNLRMSRQPSRPIKGVDTLDHSGHKAYVNVMTFQIRANCKHQGKLVLAVTVRVESL